MTFGQIDNPLPPGIYSSAVVPLCYFPPSEWFVIAGNAGIAFLDNQEHYVKQTWRNRCRIVGANGIIDLIIPVKTNGNHTPMKDVRVDYCTNWRHVHWHAIKSSYGKSPFFEFYADKIESQFKSQPKFLVEWNEQSINVALDLLKMQILKGRPDEYMTDLQYDYREILSPKWKGDRSMLPVIPKYMQVFEEKHGFQKEISILDLIFCTGPEALRILEKSV